MGFRDDVKARWNRMKEGRIFDELKEVVDDPRYRPSQTASVTLVVTVEGHPNESFPVYVDGRPVGHTGEPLELTPGNKDIKVRVDGQLRGQFLHLTSDRQLSV